MAEHKNITGVNVHEPKGADTALAGRVYISDGAGSGLWSEPPTIVTVQDVITSFSTAASQNPTGLDTVMQVEFGGGGGYTGPIQVNPDGGIQVNTTGSYTVKTTFSIGRAGTTGVASLYLRRLINGFQIGKSVHFLVSSDESYIPFVDSFTSILSENTTLTYQLIRDSGEGGNYGGLFESVPTTTGWGTSPTASVTVSRFT